MAPSMLDHGVSFPSTCLTPTTNNRAKPPQKSHQLHSSLSSNGVQEQNGRSHRHSRLLTVDEALQYSPLSSIVPFSPDIIPTPSALLPGSQQPLLDPSERKASRQAIELLDGALTQSEGPSNVAHAALQHLRPYLDQTVITKFKFKEPEVFKGSPSKRGPLSNRSHSVQNANRLSPFADLVLKSTDLVHRYPTPSSLTPSLAAPRKLSEALYQEQPGKRQNLTDPRQTLPVTPPTNKLHISSESTSGPDVQSATHGDNLSTSERARLYPVVLITPLSSEAKPDEYIKLSDDQTAGNFKKRKRVLDDRVGGGSIENKYQRVVSDEAVRQLLELAQDVFEADDQLQPETSDIVSPGSTQFFVLAYSDDREVRTLAPAIHVKLESIMQKVISSGRYCDIPLESLCRLQGLCEGALYSAESSEFRAELNSEFDDHSRWVQGIETFDLGLRSARTILRTMTGGREEKEIYSEELLQTVLRVIVRVVDTCLIPIVEFRSAGPSSKNFEIANAHKKVISQLLYDANKVLGLMAELLSKVEIAETVITALEFFVTRIIFVENAQTEKDSALGIQKFEALRRTAMDLIAEIFLRYPEQRTYLIDEILTSLQKLSVNRPHARQYKLTEGKNIQLVSALIMRLIQTSATVEATKITSKNKKPSRQKIAVRPGDPEDGLAELTSDLGEEYLSETSEDTEGSRQSAALLRLAEDATRLSSVASKNAQYVIRFYVQRAMTAPKNGDQPHRHLLDMFAEDLIIVLGFPDWPAAELLLRALLVQMVDIAENKKYTAPAKNMALELLGLMGSAISELVANTRHAAKTLENQDSTFSGYLRQLLDDYMEAKLDYNELLGWEGPYHAVLESLNHNSSGDKQIASAQGYFLTQWAKAVSSGNLAADGLTGRLVKRLRRILSGAACITTESEMEAISANQSRLSYSLVVLSMDFCRQFDRVLKILLDSISSEQITVRTRSLKSVTQMLEQDPSLLDRARNVKILIMKCATDVSSMVRDSALMLIGKCVQLKPMLEQEFCKTVLVLTTDTAIGVRKRAMRLLKDIYLRNSWKDIRAAIADNLIQRIKDPDTGVADLARQIFEEIWFSPFWKLADLTELSVQDNVILQLQVSQMVKTVQRSDIVASVMISLFRDVLSNSSKAAAANFKVCKILVRIAFENMVDVDNLPEPLEQRHILQTLTVFARANAKLFNPEQLQLLQPYITNLSSSDDLSIFRSAVVIFRCVLPNISIVQHGLLREVQTVLLHSISKLGRAELDEVAACLWTINGTLNDSEKLIKLVASVLKNLHILKDKDFTDQKHVQDLNRVKKYVRIAGYFGKHCDFEINIEAFHKSLVWWKGNSVAGLVVDTIAPFAIAKQPLSLRADALDGIGLICQSWPFQFNRENISCIFQEILGQGESELQKIVLSNFRDFFAKQERQAEVRNENVISKEETTNSKLGGSMTASDGDGASALIAQRFLKSVLRIALASQDASALTATQVITSINRQGLVHPKESGPALVALETSTNKDIADVAFQEHRKLHQQHESMFEREYMRAIQETFRYQLEIVKDPLGTTAQPLTSKLRLMFDIIKTSNGKYQKKFISNFCSRIDFDMAKWDTDDTMLNTLYYSRFLIENLAFFDYGRMDELLHTITCMEKIVANTGSGIAHNISTEIFHVNVETTSKFRPNEHKFGEETMANFNTQRLRHLSTAAVILSCLWEVRTYLRRVFGLHSTQQRRDNKGKAVAKDLNKAPSRVQGVSGERLLATIAEKVHSLNSQGTMLQECEGFIELLSIDNEVKVAADGEEDVEQPETPSGDEDHDTLVLASGGSRSLKRKGSISTTGTPQKKKRHRPSIGPRKRSGKSAASEENWI